MKLSVRLEGEANFLDLEVPEVVLAQFQASPWPAGVEVLMDWVKSETGKDVDEFGDLDQLYPGGRHPMKIYGTTYRVREACDLKHGDDPRSEEHTSELQSLMHTSYAVFCLK